MSPHHNDTYNNTGDYPNSRRRSYQPSPESQQRLAGLPALPDSTNVNQELAHGYGLAYRPQSSNNAPMNYYPARTPDPRHYGTTPQYLGGDGPAYNQHPQGNMSASYTSGQGYHQPGVNPQWAPGHHPHSGADFHRSASWPPHRGIYSAPQMLSHGSTQMSGNSGGRREVIVVPQRSYVPHHRQNYLEQFNPETPITFTGRSGREGIALTDVMNEYFDNLMGRDDPMFANYTGPAISLRLEWPGYKSWTKQIKTKDWRREPKPITKAKLATEVAKKVQNFIQDNINEPITLESEKWKVGPGFIGAGDLVLVRLVHVSKGSWQAEFQAIV